MNDSKDERSIPLDYAPQPERRGLKYWSCRFVARLSKPMPLAMYYAIMFALSIVATLLAIIIRVIVKTFE